MTGAALDWLRRPVAEPVLDLGDKTLPVAIRRHPRARRMTLRLAPDGSEVCLTVPYWCATGEALAFARSRRDWLVGQLAKVPRSAAIAPGGTLPYRGMTLAIDWRSDLPRKPRHEGQVLQIGGPQESLHPRALRWLEGEALRLFAADLALYAPLASVPLPQLALSRAQRRWGSCSVKGMVRLNWRLVMAPDQVRQSVVAHEVAHLVHFDHSPDFHACLARIYGPGLARADRWLAEQGRSLYLYG